jgi:ABC-type uncharacterized transport system substrate-binding protein
VELTQLKVDVIVTYNNAGVAALQRATRTIPIVFASVADPSRAVTPLASHGRWKHHGFTASLRK